MATFTNAAAIAIPGVGDGPGEGAPYPSNIVLAGQSGSISSVTVTFNDFEHDDPDDVHALLVGPGGEQVYLMGNQGGFIDVTGLDITFSDDAADTLPDGPTLVSGTFRPSRVAPDAAFPAPAPAVGGNELLSIFKGDNPNGTWELYTFDDAAGGVGSIASGWSITIVTDNTVNAGPGDNDIVLRRNGDNYEVEIDGVVAPNNIFPVAFTNSITINGEGGDDTLTIDSSGGLIELPGGTFFDGGAGADEVILTQDNNGPDLLTTEYSPGPTPGQGEHIATADGGAAQRLLFDNLEPVFDFLPAPTLTVNGTPADNAINYSTFTFVLTVGVVTIDEQESIVFTGKDDLIINGHEGSDHINLNGPDLPDGFTPGGLKSITVNGQDPTASDTVVVNGTVGQDTIVVNDFTTDGALVTGAQPVPVTVTTAEHLIIDGQGGDDDFTIVGTAAADRIVHTPGDAADEGAFRIDALLPVSYERLGAGGTVTADGGAGDNDTLAILGTTLSDFIDVAASTGAVTVSNVQANYLPITPANIESLSLDSLEGDDQVNIAAPLPYDRVLVLGSGPGGSDSLLIIGEDGVDETFALSLVSLSSLLDLSSIATASLDVFYSGLETVAVVGNLGDNDDLIVSDDLGDNTWTIGAGLFGAPDSIQIDDREEILYTGFDEVTLVNQRGADRFVVHPAALGGFATSLTVVADAANGDNDTLEIVGTDANDVVTAALGQVVVNGGLPIILDSDGAGFAQLTVNTLGGDDALTVDVDTTALFPYNVFFDGGSGDDLLTISGDPTDNIDQVRYVPGYSPDRGRLEYDTDDAGAEANMIVEFAGLEPVIDNVPAATLTVFGTNADNAIDYAQSELVATHGKVSVDGFEPIHFINKAELEILALAGSDEIHLGNSTIPTGLTNITVDGGPPTGSDKLIVTSVVGVDDVLNFNPTAQGAGVVDFSAAGFPDPTFVGIEHLTLSVQQAEGDEAEINGTLGDDQFEFTPGLTSDTGLFTGTMDLLGAGAGPFAMVPTTVVGVDITDDLDINADPALAGGDDTFIYNGTSHDDTIATLRTGVLGVVGEIGIQNVVNGNLFSFLDIHNVVAVRIRGGDGDDSFNHDAGVGITTNFEGGNPGASDVLTVNGVAGVNEAFIVTPDFASGSGEVTVNAVPTLYVGVEHVVLNGNAADVDRLVVNDDRADNLWTVKTGPGSGDRITIDSRETYDYDNFDTVNLVNRFGEDRFVIHPTQLVGVTATLTVTADANAPADDLVEIHGTAAADTVTSTATATTVNSSVPVVVGANGAGFAEYRLFTFAGNDNVNLDLGLPGVNKLVDGGDGNDILDLAGTSDADIYGGDGDDIITGTPLADNIYGGAGNDTINAGAGDDTIYGGEGNDTVRGNGGADRFYGGDGSDVFIWNPGDGNDLVEGGGGEADKLIFNGAAAAEVFHLFANLTDPSRFVLTRDVGAIVMDVAGVEEVDLNALGGADSITVGRANVAPNQLRTLETTEVKVVDVDLGAGDAAADNVFVDGRALDDNLLISNSNGVINVAGLPYQVLVRNSVSGAAGDRLTVRGNEGNDIIKSHNPSNPGGGGAVSVENVINITLDGGDGNDYISADAILIGGPGDDFIEGGAGDDMIFGNEGNDVMIGGAGNDTFDGGPGFDVILIRGTPGNDTIDVNQTAATTLVHTVNGDTQTDTLVLNGGVRTVEGVRVEAGDGDDTIRVTWLDALGVDANVNSLRYDIDAGTSFTRDRLGVFDNGTGDLLLYRKSESSLNGSVTIGPANAEPLEVFFTGVELTQPIAAAGGDVVVFKFDPFEFNDARTLAVHLGANDAINVDPTIDGAAVPASNGFGALPADQDFYRVIAETTGILDFQVYFRQIANVASGRPGLPGAGDLQIEVQDAAGNVIAGFGANDANDDERVRIPAVAGQTYFLRVFGLNDAINNYNITVDNYAPPTPYDIELNDILLTSTTSGAGAATSFTANAADPDLNGLPDDFFNGFDVVFTSGPLTLQRGRVVDYVAATRTFTFAAGTFTAAPGNNAAFQIETHDTGRSQFDNVTRDNTPLIRLRLDDGIFLHDLPGNPVDDTPPDEVIPIPFRGGIGGGANVVAGAGYRIAIFDEGQPQQPGALPQVPIGYATFEGDTNNNGIVDGGETVVEGVYKFTFPVALTDGSHYISARVEMVDPANPQQSGFGPRSVSMEIVVDTQTPPAFFGLPATVGDGMISDSDTGVEPPNPDTINDRITSDRTPTFWGRAEANSLITLWADVNGNGTLQEGTDLFLGQATAIPLDGTNQLPGGYWRLESGINLNDPAFFPNPDGLRTIFITAEDPAGNVNAPGVLAADTLRIFLDTQGPQITDVDINNAGNAYDLFDPKPSTDGPTPPVNSLVLSIRDLPNRVAPDFLYRAIKEDVASQSGHYQVRGDANGIIPILDVNVVNAAAANGQPATATIELVFRLPGADGVFNTGDDIGSPLLDDRYTLVVSDEGVIDLPGNRLDGESNAAEPQDNVNFPTGDGIPGGAFTARFTIDTRAEIGVWGGGNTWVDINGNFTFDSDNGDFTNRDIVFTQGFLTDGIFAGNFSAVGAANADGFDKLAAYGVFGGQTRWLIDLDHDGIPDLRIVEPSGARGLPVAANFDGNAANGDEVAIFDGTRWRLDTNHDFLLDTILPGTGMVGFPIAGDFDGDGIGDLGTWSDGVFRIDLSTVGGITGSPDFTFRFDFPGSRIRPVAGEMNADGLDDIGLFVADRPGVTDRDQAEWFFLTSIKGEGNNPPQPVTSRIVPAVDPVGGLPTIEFKPIPFGTDIYARYGDDFAVPVVGNFDPPVAGPGAAAETTASYTNPENKFDVNGDQHATNADAFFLISEIRRNGQRAVPTNARASQMAGYFDINGDGFISNADVLQLASHLRKLRRGEGEQGPFAAAASFDEDQFDLALDTIAEDVAQNWGDVEGDDLR